MGLRKGQKELVEQYRKGFCAVPAIPGGGKTHCLAIWASEIIAQGYNKPSKILIVTYMNSAVNNFKKRIAAALEVKGIIGGKDYFVTTIHGLCLQIIKDKPDIALISDDFEVIDDTKRNGLITDSINQWKARNRERYEFYVESQNMSDSSRISVLDNWWSREFGRVMLEAVGAFKCSGIGTKEAVENTRGLDRHSLLKCAAEVYEIYDSRLKIEGVLDFDDMLYNAKKILETDSALLECYRRRYSYVCEDEAQDSNQIQNDILTMIANGNLLRVGDSNQAICGSFSRSDSQLFNSFCSLPETKVFKITQSSRSSVDIINLANYFMKNVRENHPVYQCRESLIEQLIEPVPVDDERPNPVVNGCGLNCAVFNSWEDEAANVIETAGRMLREHPELSAAILIPTSFKITYAANVIETTGIPYELLDKSGSRNRAFKKIGSILSFMTKPHDSYRFAIMVSECFMEQVTDKNEKTVDEIIKIIQSRPVEQFLFNVKQAFVEEPQVFGTKLWKEVSEGFKLIRELVELPLYEIERLILLIAEKLDFDREDTAIAHKIATEARYLFNSEGMTVEGLGEELLKGRNRFSYFAGVMSELEGYEPKPGVVTLSTYHKAKGLEWDVVFLTGLTYEDFPVNLTDKFKGEQWYLKPEFRNPMAVIKSELKLVNGSKRLEDSVLMAKLENISERARLLYVGITRAKRYLFLSGHHANANRKNEVLPSRYLMELKNYIDTLRQKDQINDDRR